MQTTAAGALASAAMLYDHLPIVDVFRRLDAHTLWIPGAITTVHDEPTSRE